MDIDGWNHLDTDFKAFYNYQESETPYKVICYQSKDPEIETDQYFYNAKNINKSY